MTCDEKCGFLFLVREWVWCLLGYYTSVPVFIDAGRTTFIALSREL